MSNKTLAQLEIGSPAWIAKREAMSGNRTNADRQERSDALGFGMLALAAGVVALGVMRLLGAVGRR